MKIRNSNFELLRILSMFMIIAHHYSVHGGFPFVRGIYLNNLFLDFLYLGGQIGVVLFVLITGYHMIHSQFYISKILKLELQVLFYNVSITLLFTFFMTPSIGMLSIGDLWKAFFPTIFYSYWFSSTYLVLYLLTPYINKLLLSLQKKEYIQFLVIGLLLFILIPTFSGYDLGVGRAFLFVYFYAVGAYLKLYPVTIKLKTSILASILCYLSLFFTTILFEYFLSHQMNVANYLYHFASTNSLFVLLCSITIFEVFHQLPLKNHKWINLVASTTFGIYLIHDNMYVRSFLWLDLFKNGTFYLRKSLPLHALCSIVLVFIGCFIIELIRKKTLEKAYWSLIEKVPYVLKRFQNKKDVL